VAGPNDVLSEAAGSRREWGSPHMDKEEPNLVTTRLVDHGCRSLDASASRRCLETRSTFDVKRTE
jgi:hypothetical protein